MPDTKVATAFEKLLAQYASAGQAYQIGAHYYYSTGAYQFSLQHQRLDGNGFLRAIAFCPQGSKIDFFSYAVNDAVTGVGLAASTRATDAETNIAERQQTNDEDFAIEGLAAGSRGVRIDYPLMDTPGNVTDFIDTLEMHSQLKNGDMPWCDVGSQFLPPEFSSPLALHDTLFEAIKCFVSLQMFFDRKASDRLGRLDKVPQGGARAYLYANGEPSTHNFYRIPEGMSWRKASENMDRLLQITALVEQNIWASCTIPTLWQYTPQGSVILSYPQHLWIEWTLWLHGRAFYIPSKNV